MWFIVFLFLFFLALLSYRLEKEFFAPLVLSPFVWCILLFIYNVFDLPFDALSNKTLCIILIWNVSLWGGAFVAGRYKRSHPKYMLTIDGQEIDDRSLKIYWIIAIVGWLWLLGVGYRRIVGGGFDNIFLSLRLADTGLMESDYNYGIGAYAGPIIYLLLLVELLKKKKSKIVIIILVIMNLGLVILTQAKTVVLLNFGGCIIALFLAKKIRIRKLIMIGFVLMGLMMGIQCLRAADSEDVSIVNDLLLGYILGGLPAFDQIVMAGTHSTFPGILSLSFFYTLLGALGILSPPIVSFFPDIFYEGGYLFVPQPTNVYTVLYRFWTDFSYGGIIIFGLLTGIIAGYFYRLVKLHKLFGILVYSFVCCALMLQFFADYLISGLSYLLQIIFWSGMIGVRVKKIGSRDL